MEQATLWDLIELGKDAWNQWRNDNANISINLTGADFSNKDLSGFDFTEANLS